VRLIAGYAAIAFILPYLALKIAWVCGAPVGMLDKDLVDDPRVVALNVLTFCMDAVAVLLALAFTHGWGLRVPARPLLLPMWIGTGFLAPLVAAVPMIALARILGLDPGQRPAPGASAGAQALVEPWARGVVFTSFVGQGAALVTAFILYVRVRWGGILKLRTDDGQRPRRAIVVLGSAASVLATLVGLLHLLWATGASRGLPPHLLQNRGANFYMLQATFGLAALAAAAGMLMLVHRHGRWTVGLASALAWLGAGAMFAWGGWLALATALRLSPGEGAGLFTATHVIKMVAGLSIGALLGLRVAAAARRS
jgi:hypothetical protein